MQNEIVCIHNEPMHIVEKISRTKGMKIMTCIDKDYNVVVYIPQLSRVKNKKYLSNLEGRGQTYREACIDFIKNLMDNNFNIRYNNDFYVTELMRTCVIEEGYNYIERWCNDDTCN